MGIYLIESGEVQLLLPARQKQYKIFDCAGTGAVLGLSEAMSGSPHKMMAEAVGPVEIAYVERMALMNFLAEHCEVCMQIVALLSEDLHGLYRRFRMISPAEWKQRKSQPQRTQRLTKDVLPS
jgi:CRP-like cAMP-binding protein